MENIITKLNELKSELNSLKKIHYKEGENKYYSITQLIERIIDRVYPEKDAKQMKRNLSRGVWLVGNQTDLERQQDYTHDIDLKIRVIDTILEESKLFGFDDFKPLKEKIEKEWQVGSNKLGFFRKKETMEKNAKV